jgi:hypothetical protein
MARVKIERILDRLSSDLTRALDDALARVGVTAIDARELYREFVRAADRRCNTWERVPDSAVDAEED